MKDKENNLLKEFTKDIINTLAWFKVWEVENCISPEDDEKWNEKVREVMVDLMNTYDSFVNKRGEIDE